MPPNEVVMESPMAPPLGLSIPSSWTSCDSTYQQIIGNEKIMSVLRHGAGEDIRLLSPTSAGWWSIFATNVAIEIRIDACGFELLPQLSGRNLGVPRIVQFGGR
ncbi:hypothetical protein FQR65_LT20334 [Abscondita terminalis]|nr:hypothetical protein FQR65_LT20334 [Abscondita terminalis]